MASAFLRAVTWRKQRPSAITSALPHHLLCNPPVPTVASLADKERTLERGRARRCCDKAKRRLGYSHRYGLRRVNSRSAVQRLFFRPVVHQLRTPGGYGANAPQCFATHGVVCLKISVLRTRTISFGFKYAASRRDVAGSHFPLRCRTILQLDIAIIAASVACKARGLHATSC